MKKIVISGSASLQDEAIKWTGYWTNKGYEVLDYPVPIDKSDFLEKYPEVHHDFYERITKTDVLFIMNEDKKGINGYMGASAFAELAFGVAQNTVYGKNIDILIMKMPDPAVQCYDEVTLWLSLGWVGLMHC